MAFTFLEAEWRKLLMFNYSIDPSILYPFLPSHTELDFWNDTCHVSLVGFMFLNTRVRGLPIPFHRNFEEVNLRFYVRYKDGGIWKRGVVFLKEIVPKPALSFVANTIYKENYETMPMTHRWKKENNLLEVEYCWKKEKWHSIRALAHDTLTPISNGSEAEFITEHYWGYTRNSIKTSEYEVAHPKWDTYPVQEYAVNVDFEKIYGKVFGFLTGLAPTSVFLAEGSEISVNSNRILSPITA